MRRRDPDRGRRPVALSYFAGGSSERLPARPSRWARAMSRQRLAGDGLGAAQVLLLLCAAPRLEGSALARLETLVNYGVDHERVAGLAPADQIAAVVMEVPI